MEPSPFFLVPSFNSEGVKKKGDEDIKKCIILQFVYVKIYSITVKGEREI